MLAGNLIAVGGTVVEGHVTNNEVYMYTLAGDSCWIDIGDLPAPRYAAAVASLSPSEILVIGGRYSGIKRKSVYKGTLYLKI